MTESMQEALERLQAAVVALQRARKPKSTSDSAVREMGATQTPPPLPPAAVLEEVRERLRVGTRQDRDIMLAPWILWNGNPPAVSFPGLLDRITRDAQQRRRILRNLIEAWLRDFRRDARKIEEAGFGIERLLVDGSNDRLDPWREAHRRYRMFHADTGPEEIARDVSDGTASVPEILRFVGLDDPARSTNGYMRAVHDACLGNLEGVLTGQAPKYGFDRIVEILTVADKLRFDGARRDIARSMLNLWVRGSGPGTEAQFLAKDFVLRHVGHPQLRPRAWLGLDQEAAVVRRWLAQSSLEVFFELFREHADWYQWSYREAFWSACLKKCAIADAWLILGSAVDADARARKGFGVAFGKLSGANASHAVLLMRIGTLTFAEWSHNGKLRIWPSDKGPPLFRSSYTRDELTRGAAREISHHGSDTGRWQQNVAEILRRYVGCSLHYVDWQP